MNGKEIRFIEFIVLIALLMALVSVTINMLLPAFQSISTDFQLKDKNQIHSSISLLYLGLGISQLLYGSFSDSIGRKPTIYIGLVLFVIGCIISWQSSNLTVLLVGQVMQGLGLGAPRVISLAIVRDKFEGVQMARAVSFIMVIYMVTPIVSPIFGRSIISALNWRALFAIYIGFAVLIFLLFKFRMPETLPKVKRKKFTLKHLREATEEILKNKSSLSYILVLGLYSGVFIAYLNLSQVVFEFQYHLGEQYPYYFAFLALSIGLASYINGKLVNRLGVKTITRLAIIGSISFTIPLLLINYFMTIPFWIFVVFMFVQLFSYGLLIGNLNAMAMKPLGHIAGLGASVVGAISTIISVPLSIFIGSFYTDSIVPIVIAFLAVGVVSILMINSSNYTLNMKDHIIDNLFELWQHIGSNGQFLHVKEQYCYVKPDNYSWPSKVFKLKESEINFKELYQKIKNGNIPDSISILENEVLETQLLAHNFKLKSIVKGMYLNLTKKNKPIHDFASIGKVDNEVKAIEFAKIASLSFGYEILSSTIISLINSSQLKLFIGKHRNNYASCGMVLLDKKGISGLHMIGTTPEYRGLGLGKIMTNKLLFESFENKSKQVVLVASESGEHIYSKLGFITHGNLKSYSVSNLM